MSATAINSHYGVNRYATSAAQSKAAKKAAETEAATENSKSTASDTVELSDEAKAVQGAPTVDEFFESVMPVSLDDLEGLIKSGQDELRDIVQNARDESGLTGQANVFTQVVGGRVYTLSLHAVEMTDVIRGDEGFAITEDDRISANQGKYTKPGDKSNTHESMEQGKIFSNSLFQNGYTSKFQTLTALTSIYTLAQTNDAFKSEYEADPLSALANFRGELTNLAGNHHYNSASDGSDNFFFVK